MKITRFYLILFCLTVALAASAGSAWANTAANTEIINSARLTFAGGSASATVTVTVALVPSQPNVYITNANGAYTAPDTPALTDSVVVTSTANGPADYTVTPSVDGSTNTTAPSVTGGATVSIGASVTTGVSGTTYVTVPASGASVDNAAVNGIAVNDTIVFSVNGNTYTRQVTSTTDNGNGTFRLNWTGAVPGADVPGTGVQVGEQKTVNLSVKPGTVSIPGTDITVTVQAVVNTLGVADIPVTNSTPNLWTTPSPNVNMTKYVRNLTADGNSGASGAISLTVNGSTNTYYTSGVRGKPGNVLEYAIVASNTGGAALTGCAISDLVPVDFVNFKTSVYGFAGADVFYVDPDNLTFIFTAGAVGVNQASFVAGNDPNFITNVGSGATNAQTGTIAADKSVTIAYQVTIK